MKKVKLALVGIGAMGKNYLATASKIPGVKITHVCARTDQRLMGLKGTYIKLTDYHKLPLTLIDGVIIATPASTHFEIAHFFISKNIPTLIEKPLVTSFKQALVLARLQSLKKTPVLVGHTLLYHPAYLKLKQILPKLGKIKSLLFEGANNNPRVDTTLLWDWGPHGLSCFMDLIGSEPSSVETTALTDKKIEIKLLFKNIIASCLISWQSQTKVRRLSIFGSRGSLKFDDLAGPKLLFLKNNHQSFPKYSRKLPLGLQLREFINAIKKGSRIRSDLSFGVLVTKILHEVEKNIKL